MYTLVVRDVDAFGIYEDIFEYETFEDVYTAYEKYADSAFNPLMGVEDASRSARFVWCEGQCHNERPDDEYQEVFEIRYVDRATGECIEEEASSYEGLKEIARKKASPENSFIVAIVDNNGCDYEYSYNSWKEM